MKDRPPERYFDFVREVISSMTFATASTLISGMMLVIPLHYVKNPWLKAAYSTAGVTTVGLVSCLLESRRQYYVKALRNYIDVNDQIEVQGRWENRNNKVLPPAQSPEGAIDAEMPEGLGFITWDTFVTEYINNPVQRPHFSIIGATGDGKSLTAEVIGDKRAEYYRTQNLTARCVYLSPTVDTNEFLGWEPVGNGFNKKEIEDFGNYLASVLIYRYTDKDADKSPVIVTNDEYRWSSRRTDLYEVVNDTLAMGRKQNLNVITTNVTNLVASQGMSGEGDLRKNYTVILKGQSAVDYIRTQEKDGHVPEGSTTYCEDLLAQHPYTFTVVQNINKIMMLPDLSTYRSTKINQNWKYKPVQQSVTPAPIEEEPKKRTNKFRS